MTYLRELARHADVYYLADGVLEPGELDKLADVTRGAWSVPHAGYDFGSFSLLARDLVGWDVVDTYDELLLANDSCFLLHPLDEVFAADGRPPGRLVEPAGDVHGARRELLPRRLPDPAERGQAAVPRPAPLQRRALPAPQLLLPRVPATRRRGPRASDGASTPSCRRRPKALVVHKYEVGISRYLVDAGFEFDTCLPELQPFHPLYSRHVFDLVERGFPLVKRNFLGENPRRAPDVGRWRERLRDVAPMAHAEEMAANIARVTDPARLHDAYDVTQDSATGRRTVRPSPLAGHPFRRMDRETPSFSHWWAFAAGPSGRLDPGVRAVLDAVRDDPSLHAVVLTRTRALLDDVSGARVTVVPIGTREGQETVVRCGVLVLGDPLEVALPHVVLPARHRIVHVGAPFAAGTPAPVLGIVDAVAASSVREADAWRAAEPGLAADGAWLTGLPRHDLLLPGAGLPPDLARAEAELRARLAGRPLVVLTANGPATYTPADVALLQDWARDAGVVVGVREPRPDAPHGLTRLLAPLAPVGLNDRSVVSEAVVLRAASAVVADSPAGRSDARAAGHPLLVKRAGEHVDPLLAELSSLAAAGWPAEAGPADDGEVPLDGGAARRFVHRVRLREVERLEISRAR